MNNENIGTFRLDLTDNKIVTFMKYKKKMDFQSLIKI